MYERVLKIAAEKGLSIYKLEQMAGLGNGTIGKWRNGKEIRSNTLMKVSKALDVSVDYLLGITDEP